MDGRVRRSVSRYALSRLRDRHPAGVVPEQAVRELRLELREKLWICPLCQRRSQIRRIIDRETFSRIGAIKCGGDSKSSTRSSSTSGWPTKRLTRSVVYQLPRLSEIVGRDGNMPFLSADNWRTLAGATTK